MPTYRYRCAKCGDELEQWQSFHDEPLVKHEGCGGKLAKVLSTPGIVLKGSGFYRTDNRNGAKRGAAKREEPSESTASSEGDSKSPTSSKTGTTEPAATRDGTERKESSGDESSKPAQSST